MKALFDSQGEILTRSGFKEYENMRLCLIHLEKKITRGCLRGNGLTELFDSYLTRKGLRNMDKRHCLIYKEEESLIFSLLSCFKMSGTLEFQAVISQSMVHIKSI